MSHVEAIDSTEQAARPCLSGTRETIGAVSRVWLWREWLVLLVAQFHALVGAVKLGMT